MPDRSAQSVRADAAAAATEAANDAAFNANSSATDAQAAQEEAEEAAAEARQAASSVTDNLEVSVPFHVVTDSAYGAQGDGTTDDTAALQSALDDAGNTGGTVYIPSGVYLITESLNVRDGTTILGDGYKSEIHVADSGLTYITQGSADILACLLLGTSSSAPQNIEIRGVRCFANAEAAGAAGVNAGSNIFHYGIISRFPDGVSSGERARRIQVDQCYVYDANIGIGIVRSGNPDSQPPDGEMNRDIIVSNCHVGKTFNKAIELQETQNGRIIGNSCDDVAMGPQFINYCENVSMVGNTVRFTNAGLYLSHGTSNATIANNSVFYQGGFVPVSFEGLGVRPVGLYVKVDENTAAINTEYVSIVGNVFNLTRFGSDGGFGLAFQGSGSADEATFSNLNFADNQWRGCLHYIGTFGARQSPADYTIRDLVFEGSKVERLVIDPRGTGSGTIENLRFDGVRIKNEIPQIEARGDVQPGTSKVGGESFNLKATHYDKAFTQDSGWSPLGGAFTIQCWVNLDTLPSNLASIVSKWEDDPFNEWIIQYDPGNNEFRVVVSEDGSSTSTSVGSGVSASTGSWFHILAGYDGTDVFIEVNAGTRSTATPGSGSVVSSGGATLCVGGQGQVHFTTEGSSGDDPIDGKVDGLAFWERGLSTSEVDTLYNSGNGQAYADLSSSMKTDLSRWVEDVDADGSATDEHATAKLFNNADNCRFEACEIFGELMLQKDGTWVSGSRLRDGVTDNGTDNVVDSTNFVGSTAPS